MTAIYQTNSAVTIIEIDIEITIFHGDNKCLKLNLLQLKKGRA